MPRILNSLYARFWLAANKSSVPQYQGQLQQILLAHENQAVVIFPPGLGWVIQLFQRPQQLAQALARQGVLVFYIEPVHPSSKKGFQQKDENLYLCHVPLETFRILDAPYLHVMTWNERAVQRFNRPMIIYDYLDDLDAFQGDRRRLESAHQKLLRDASLVLATARRLFEQIQVTRPDALLVPNGVDFDHFSSPKKCESWAVPADLAPILAERKPVVGYHGALARWFDFTLFEKVVLNRQDLNFVLVGPEIDNSLRDSSLLNLKNTHWLGTKPYQELPGYVRCFDVAVIPFKVNQITHSTSPLKLYEYLAAGKPVVITPMEESLRLGAALPAEGVDEFCRQLDRAMQLRGDANYLDHLQQIAQENTWDRRASQILQALHT
jgi:glycosyltransferase involved in cell wall biosynthesis